ncbi:hypothetical protein AQUCO_01100507v1 [Aquilegia coerulea]|uniref:KIB1-4 beta-propeller domain-containing protein n=1 Tax=Aquilegia coerulea TaxID=218851 RepID=A0A2G5E7F7_AQUCA|nr:hypothetical protein AQUCO_01100507v1 [Aquilegia coerulea]
MERSVRGVPPTYAPSLVISHGKKYRDQTFCTIYDGCYHVRSVLELRQMLCLGSYYGWLMLKNYYSTECYLFNPITLTKINLPPLIHDTMYMCVLTYPPCDPKCVIMFFSQKTKSCIFCRIGDTKWVKQELEPNKKSRKLVIAPFCGAISCQGKIYLFYDGGMAVIDVYNSFASIKLDTLGSYDLSIPGTWCHRTFILESCGEIFLVAQMFLGISHDIILSLDVFKLDLSTMGWVKVQTLGDWIFLLGTSSTSLSEAEFGVKGNCIYFCPPRCTTLCRYDMDSGAITITLPCPKKFSQWGRPFWMVPNCTLQVKNEVAKVETIKNEKHENWKDCPSELLDLILENLFFDDCIRFRLTCKAWISMTPPRRSFLLQNKSGSHHLPWLLSFPKNNMSACILNHPIYSDAYVMNLTELEGNKSLFFFNPSTMETIKIPYPDFGFVDYNIRNISFSCPPTSPDCVVFGHSMPSEEQVRFLVYFNNDKNWYRLTIEVPYLFLTSCNPVLHDGLFYSLSKDGRLGVFDPDEAEEENTWRVLPNTLVPEACSSSVVSLHTSTINSYIMESDGEILSVFVGLKCHEPITVYKLDQSMMKWVKLESLGDKVLFLSHTTSMSVSAGLKGIENRIYLSRFKGKENLFYSLSSGNYHCFEGKESRPDLIDTCEQWNCTWIETYLDGQCDDNLSRVNAEVTL